MSEVVRATAKIYRDPRFYDKSRIRSIRNRQRREKQLRRRVLTFVVMTSLIIFLAIFLSYSFLSDAKSENEMSSYRYYSSVTVSAGDSVWSIAENNMDRMHYNNVESYVRDIASVNKISTDAELKAGSSLIIPYYSSTPINK